MCMLWLGLIRGIGRAEVLLQAGLVACTSCVPSLRICYVGGHVVSRQPC